jgi:hypothetical protein
MGAIAAFVCDRRVTEPLLVSRAGAPVTDRSVHEQLRRIGELAGLGEWVSCRHTRRTYISAIARCHLAPVALRLGGHAGFRIRPVSIEDALQAELGLAWTSPLDEMLARVERRQAA